MSESVWLKEGDVVISKISFKYFNDLIDFVDSQGLKDKFREWCKMMGEKQCDSCGKILTKKEVDAGADMCFECIIEDSERGEKR